MEKNGKHFIVGFDEDSLKEVLIETSESIGNLDDDAFGMIRFAQYADEKELEKHSAKELEFLVSNLCESRIWMSHIIDHVNFLIRQKKMYESEN